ncbi:MAG TPA: 30S ribosomal protein S17 [Pirellulaceae bacterium]|nr:30S ribosomal protein S17 [Pirellulaceae bacterium]
MPKRILTGVVTRDKATKTRRVEVPRQVRHPIYGKILHRRTVCYAHDEENVSKSGDTVEIEESPPLSKLKRWVLKRVVAKAKQTGPDVAEIAGEIEQQTKE